MGEYYRKESDSRYGGPQGKRWSLVHPRNLDWLTEWVPPVAGALGFAVMVLLYLLEAFQGCGGDPAAERPERQSPAAVLSVERDPS